MNGDKKAQIDSILSHKQALEIDFSAARAAKADSEKIRIALQFLDWACREAVLAVEQVHEQG